MVSNPWTSINILILLIYCVPNPQNSGELDYQIYCCWKQRHWIHCYYCYHRLCKQVRVYILSSLIAASRVDSTPPSATSCASTAGHSGNCPSDKTSSADDFLAKSLGLSVVGRSDRPAWHPILSLTYLFYFLELLRSSFGFSACISWRLGWSRHTGRSKAAQTRLATMTACCQPSKRIFSNVRWRY